MNVDVRLDTQKIYNSNVKVRYFDVPVLIVFPVLIVLLILVVSVPIVLLILALLLSSL